MILDPDIDTLYLCLASIQALPMLVEGIEQIRAWSTHLAANATKLTPLELNIARQRYAVWDADVRTGLKTYKAFIEKIHAYNPSTRSALDLTFLAAAQDYRAQAYAAVDAPAPEDAKHLWNLGEAVFEQSHAQYQAVLPTLEDLLTQRLQRIDSKQWWLTLSALLTLSFAGYLFYSFYRNTVRDMAQKRQEEAALRQAMQTAEQANLAKSQFLANMSHEIRTPMNGVLGMTDLAYELAQDTTQKTYLQTVKSSAESLLVILNEILDFSKIEAGQLHIENIPLDLRQLVTQTMAGMQARLKKKQLTLECDLAQDLPPTMLGDPGRIRQVLTNLCDNAIKFTHKGGLTVTVQCELAKSEMSETSPAYTVRIALRDTGVGIPPEKQRVIFEAFSQADTSTTREYGGTGLGLTICARLVELMGGKISVESALGTGSTFAFTMRLGQAVQPDVPAAPLAEPQPKAVTINTTPEIRALKVLLVEDHPVNQLLAATLLKKMGHSVVVANNGQEAVNLFPTAAWDIVLMDLQMPVMGGLEAAPLIRTLEPAGQRTPIIAVTANAMDSDREACLASGMDAHLAKPIRSTELQETIARFCAG